MPRGALSDFVYDLQAGGLLTFTRYCAAGDTHCALDRLYADVLAFEATPGATFAYVLHVADFRVWPDPDRVDRATRAHDGPGH